MKTLTKKKAKELPVAAIRDAYAIQLTPEAIAKLRDVQEAAEFATSEADAAAKIMVRDEDTNSAASECVVNLTKVRKMLEELQKFYTGPLESRKKQVIATFKKLGEYALGQEARLRAETEAWFQKKLDKQREDERKRIAEEQEKQRKARMLGKSAPPPLASAPVEEIPRSTETENGKLGFSLVWELVGISDENAIPRQYLSVDEKKIRAAIAAGVREIPGVVIKERPQSAVR